jgi:hypothetical protein
MSQNFKLNFEQMRRGEQNEESQPNADNQSAQQNDAFSTYPAVGNGRMLCFVWPDGKRVFLNYAYLISGELKQEEPDGLYIILTFSSGQVTMKGTGLEVLYEALVNQSPKTILVSDSRYIQLDDSNETVVTEITLQNISRS